MLSMWWNSTLWNIKRRKLINYIYSWLCCELCIIIILLLMQWFPHHSLLMHLRSEQNQWEKIATGGVIISWEVKKSLISNTCGFSHHIIIIPIWHVKKWCAIKCFSVLSIISIRKVCVCVCAPIYQSGGAQNSASITTITLNQTYNDHELN